MKMSPCDRYRHDNRFYALTQRLVALLEEGFCDYATLQEASVFASIEHSQIHGAQITPSVRQWMEKGALS